MTKVELLERIRADRDRLDALVAALNDAQMLEPALEGGRSVKDVLAHISAWEKIGMALVRNNEPIQAPAPGEDSSSTDVINDKVFEESSRRSLDEVLSEAHRSYAELVVMIERMSEDELDASLGAGQEGADRSPRVGEVISGNSYDHYREHIAQIESWLGKGG